jgi:hypothetical protein
MAFNFSPGGVYNPRPLDFSALADLPEDFWKGQEQGRQAGLRDALKGGLPTLPDGSIDWAGAASLVGQFDPQLGMRTAAYAQKATMDPYQAGTLALAQQKAATDEKELALKYPEGKPRRSATDTKALYEAQDELPDVDNTIALLKRAEEINDETFEGTGASLRGTLGAKLPDWAVPDQVADPKTATATNEWEMLMAPAALEKMSETLKGQTSNLELQRYIGFLADPSTPKDTRKNIIGRLKALAERQKAVRAQRIEDLGGEAPTSPGVEPQTTTDGVIDFNEYFGR